MPLVTPFRTSYGEDRARQVLLVRIQATDGHGWGECAAPLAPLYATEYVEGARHVIRHHLLPRLMARRDLAAEDVAATLAGVQGHAMAKAALEMAVLDADLRSRGVSLSDHLGGVRTAVEAGVAVGMASSTAELLDAVERVLAAGYRRVKLKIGPGWDLEPLAAVRRAFGREIMLFADANGAYRRDDEDLLARLDDAGLRLLEQPLPPDMLCAHAALARRLRTPICLDETVTSPDVAADAIALGAAAVVNVKAPRVGGYLAALRVAEVCEAAGVPAWCGGMLDTGIGRAANLALSSVAAFTLPGDLSPPSHYLAGDVVVDPLVLEGGTVRVPTGPGLGVEVDDAMVARLRVAHERLPPG